MEETNNQAAATITDTPPQPTPPKNYIVSYFKKKYYPNKSDEDIHKSIYQSKETFDRATNKIYTDQFEGRMSKEEFDKVVDTSYGNPFKQPPLKKKAVPAATGSKPSSDGSDVESPDYLKELHVGENQPYAPAPLTDEAKADYIQKKQAFSKQLSEQLAAYESNTGIKLGPDGENATIDNAKEKTFVGSIKLGARYLLSKALHGLETVGAGEGYLLNKIGMISDEELATGNKKVNEGTYSNLGLGKTYRENGPDNMVMQTAGALAEFAAPMAMASPSGGGSFYLQGLGNASTQVSALKEKGVKFDHHTDDLYIQGAGIINYLLMNRLNSNVILNKLPKSLREDVVGKLSAEAIKDVANSTEGMTVDNMANTFANKAMSFSQRLQQYGLDALKSYRNTAIDLGALSTSDYALKAGVNALNKDKPFEQSPGDLIESYKKILTGDAVGFSVLHGLTNSGVLFNKAPYKNAVVDNLQRDNSPENVAAIKQEFIKMGADKGWSRDETANTVDTIDQIADVANSIPKNIPPANFKEAVDIVMGRRQLDGVLKEAQAKKVGLDPALAGKATAFENLVKAKVEQADDKLAELVSNKKYAYGEENGNYYKQMPGEEYQWISKDRFDLEQTENAAKPVAEQNRITTGPPVSVTSGGKTTHLSNEDVDYLRTLNDQGITDVLDQKQSGETLVLKNNDAADNILAALKKRDELAKEAAKAKPADAKPAASVETPASKPEAAEASKPAVEEVADALDTLKQTVSPVGENDKPIVKNEETTETAGTPAETTETAKQAKPAAPQEVTAPVDEKPQPNKVEISPARKKAIDAVTHGIVVPEQIMDNDPSARFDIGMTTAEKRKALKDIHAGKYNTAPAKKLLDKIEEFENNDDYPIIEGLGGNSVRSRGATAADIQQGIDDAKTLKLNPNLTLKDIEHNNALFNELGISHNDIENYENYRTETERGDNGSAAGSVPENVQQTGNDQAASPAQATGDTGTQTEPAKVGDKFVNDGNHWTHLTNSSDLIKTILNGGEFIGKGEDVNNFTKEISKDRFTINKQNGGSPYFQKGKFYGEPGQKYLIVTKGDEKFTPNVNRINSENLEKSGGIGVLNPENRSSENFDVYQKGEDGNFYKIDKIDRDPADGIDKYFISKTDGYEEVEGESVPNNHGLDLFAHKLDNGTFNVTEGSTGLRMGNGLTKKDAIAKAMENIESKSSAEIQAMIKNKYEGGLQSPRGIRTTDVAANIDNLSAEDKAEATEALATEGLTLKDIQDYERSTGLAENNAQDLSQPADDSTSDAVQTGTGETVQTRPAGSKAESEATQPDGTLDQNAAIRNNAANTELSPEGSFIDRVGEAITNSEKLNIISLRKLATELGIDGDDIKLQDLAETAIVRLANDVALNPELTDQEKLNKIVDIYNRQPSFNQRSSDRIALQQYSTPAPTSFIGGLYGKAINPVRVFEPSAGNGLLTVAFKPKTVSVNEIDKNRIANLNRQGFGQVSAQDATHSFGEARSKDFVISNPPFGKAPEKVYDGYRIAGLDEQMIINALNEMKDTGRGVFIMGGHNKYDVAKRLASDRTFFNYLYSHYNVSDVINVDGSLYQKQGTTFPIRMILINGRKAEVGGVSPLKDEVANKPVSSFQELFDRVQNKILNDENKNLLQPGMDAERNPMPLVYGADTFIGEPQAATGTDTLPERQAGPADRGIDTTGGERSELDRGQDRPADISNNTDRGSAGTAGQRELSTLPGGSNTAGDRAGEVAAGDKPAGSDAGVRPNRPEQDTRQSASELVENEKIPYAPTSNAPDIGSVIPSNMATEAKRMLDQIEKEHGSIDVFVSTRLGYPSMEALYNAFSAEQIDALAMGITQMEAGQGMIVGDMTGLGKGRSQPLTAKILTKNGFTTMGNIKIGDKIISVDGNETEVLGIYPQGVIDVYEVEFTDGTKTEASADHLWTTNNKQERDHAKKLPNSLYAQPKVRTTLELIDHLHRSISIPLVSSINFDYKETPIDPYLLGVILGDGYIRKDSVQVVMADAEILASVTALLPEGLSPQFRGRYHYDFTNGKRGLQNKLMQALRSLELTGKTAQWKFIPEIYLKNSTEVRLAVLQGLIDTDGYVEKRGSCMYYTVSDELADDVQWLVRSLGGTTTRGIKKTYRLDCHVVYLKLPNGMNPCRLMRKANLIKAKVKYPPIKYVKSVTLIGKKECQCIKVDHLTSLYVTDDFIVTHNTAAGMIRYGIKRGKTPIFLTEKATLFSDLYRDLVDIGSSQYVPFIVNDKSSDNDPTITDANGVVVHKVPATPVKNKALKDSSLPNGYDFVMATYSQFTSSKPSEKKTFLQSVSIGQPVVMDESHNVSGTSNSGAFFQDVLGNVQGVMYLSATFAKRPDNMPVYALKTAMQEANMTNDELVAAITHGGVALQEIVSAQLVESGQMLRRERDFTGVKNNFIELNTLAKDHRSTADSVTDIVRDIIAFQRDHINDMITSMDEDIAEAGGRVEKRRGTVNAGVDNTPYASKVFNVIDQMLFAIKAEAVADSAIQHLKENKKPVIAFKSTMESFLKNSNIEVGDTIEKPNFALSLLRGLKSAMAYTETNDRGDKIKKDLSVSDLSPEGQDAYHAIADKINKSSVGISISPIDVIIKKIKDAGYTVGEITGRKMQLEFQPDGSAKVMARDDRDIKKIVRQFNNGEGIDVILLNASGATGLSMHASAKFKDQRQRAMVSHQLELDINKEIQKRGRIDRSGQVERGLYDTVFSSIPAEQRLAMMFKTKLKSLDANTTSSQKSKSSEEINDFLNKYGDRTVIAYLKEHPDVNEALLDPFKMNEMDEAARDRFSNVEGAASKVTGRVAILPSDQQEAFYKEITRRYQDLIQYLEDTNQNDLEVKSLPLEAETVSKKPYILGKGGRTPFGQDSMVETVKSNILKKPLSKDELEKEISDNLNGVTASQKQRVLSRELADYYDERIKEMRDFVRFTYSRKREKASEKKYKNTDELSAQLQTLKELEAFDLNQKVNDLENSANNVDRVFQAFRVGEEYDVPNSITSTGTKYSRGVFIGFEMGNATANPFAPSNIKMRFAVLDGRRIVAVPLSQNDFVNSTLAGKMQRRAGVGPELRAEWGNVRSDNVKETRHIVTGNILQAYTGHGQLVAYTTSENQLRKGILMPPDFSPEKQITVPATRALKALLTMPVLDKLVTTDNTIAIQKLRGSRFVIEVPASKSLGGDYFLDADLRSVVDGNNFNTSGGKMVGEFDQVKLPKVLTILQSTFNKSFKIDEDEVFEEPAPDQQNKSSKDYIFDQTNVKPMLDFLENLKIKGGKLFSSLVPIPPAVFNKAIDVIKSIVKVTNSAQKAVRVAVRYLKDNGATKDQVSSFVQAMQDFFENTPSVKKMFEEQQKAEDRKANMQNTLNTTVAEAEQLIETGMLTESDIKGFRTKLTEVLSEARKLQMIKTGESDANKANDAISSVNSINRNNPDSLMQAISAVQSFFNNVGDKGMLKKAMAGRAELRPFLTKKDSPLPATMLKDLVRISPDTLTPGELEEYAEITGTLTEQLNGDLPGLVPNERIVQFTDAIKRAQEERLKDRLVKKYAQLGATDAMSIDELTDIKNAAAKLSEDDLQEPVERVNKKRAVLDMFIDDARELVRKNMDRVEPEYRAQVDAMLGLNTDALSTGEMKLYNQVLNNVAINNDYQGVGLFSKYSEADKDMAEFKDYAAKYQNQFRQISFGQFGKDLVKGSNLSKLSLSDKFFHLNSEREVGNKLDSVMALPINQGYQKQQQQKSQLSEGFRAVVKKNKLDRENMFRVGVFSDLSEHDLSMGTTKQEQFTDGVERLRQAVERLRPFKTKYENTMFTTLSNIYDQVKTAANINDLSHFLTPEEMELYYYTQDSWKSTYPKLKENTDLYSFDELGSIENYAHRKYYNVGGKIDVNLVDDDNIDVRTGSTTREAKTKVGRTVRRTLPEGKIIDYNVFNSFNKGMNETLNDIHTLGARIKANRMLKSKELPGIIDISDRYKKTNTQILTDGVKLMVNVQRGIAKSDSDLYGSGQKLTSWVRQAFYTHTTGAALSGIPQYASSVAFVLPQLEHRGAFWKSFSMFVGGAVGGDKEFRHLGRELMQKVGGGTINRDLQGDQELSEQLNHAAETLFGQYASPTLSDMVQKLQDAYFYSLKLGDRSIALHAWMAGYINSLIKQHVIGSSKEFTKEFLRDHLKDPNQMAAAEAEALVTISNNESDSSRRPETFVNKSYKQEFVNDILYPLKKFAVSMYNKMMLGVRNISEQNGGEIDGAKLILGAVASSVVFNTISQFVLGKIYDEGGDLVMQAIGEWDNEQDMLDRKGITREQIDQQKFEQKKLNLVTSTVADLFLNGHSVIVENGVKAATNLVYQNIADNDSAPTDEVDEWGKPVKKKDYGPKQLFYSGNNPSEMMGIYSDTPLGVLFDIPLDKHNPYNVMQEQFKYHSWEGLLSKRVLFSVGVPTLSATGLLPADATRINNRVKNRMEKLYQIEKEFKIKYKNKDNPDFQAPIDDE